SAGGETGFWDLGGMGVSGWETGVACAPKSSETLGAFTGWNKSGLGSTGAWVVVFERTWSRRARRAPKDSSASAERFFGLQKKRNRRKPSVALAHSERSNWRRRIPTSRGNRIMASRSNHSQRSRG